MVWQPDQTGSQLKLSLFSAVALQVSGVLPLKGGPPPKYAQRTQLITENYQAL